MRTPYDIGAIERALAELRADVAFPPTPDLATAVRRDIAAGRVSPRPRPVWSGRLAYAALVAVVVVAAILVTSPAARRAVAGWLGLRGVRIGTTEASPPTRSIVAPRAAATALGLGEPVTLEEAAERVSFDVMLPRLSELGPPDAVYAGTSPYEGQVSLAYGPRPGYPEAASTGLALLVTEFRARLDDVFIEKLVAQGAHVDALEVNGGRAFWIEGDHAVYFYEDLGSGEVVQSAARLAGNTLLWEMGDVTVRLESALPQAAAIRVAESVR